MRALGRSQRETETAQQRMDLMTQEEENRTKSDKDRLTMLQAQVDALSSELEKAKVIRPLAASSLHPFSRFCVWWCFNEPKRQTVASASGLTSVSRPQLASRSIAPDAVESLREATSKAEEELRRLSEDKGEHENEMIKRIALTLKVVIPAFAPGRPPTKGRHGTAGVHLCAVVCALV